MSEADISPLARRLAEENNVDWRVLQGSGAGGKVVERDVLEFLARVMAGEEELDPTPEPVPEGMESWPEDDMRSFQSELRASRKNVGLDDIQKELSASDRLGGAAMEGASEAHAAAPAPFASEPWEADVTGAPDSPPVDVFGDADVAEGDDDAVAAADTQDGGGAISEDIFLFDEDDGGRADAEVTSAAPVPPMGGAMSGVGRGEDLDDDLLIAGDDALAGGDAGFAAPDDTDDLWSGALEPEEHDDLPEVFGAAASRVAEEPAIDVFGESASASGVPELDVSDLPDLGDLDREAVAERAEAGVLEDAAFGEDATTEESSAAGGAADEPAELGHSDREWDEAIREVSFRAEDDNEVGEVEPVVWDGAEAEAAVEDEAGTGEDTEAGVLAAVAPDTEEIAAEVVAELPLVSYGTLLRRHVDLTALAGAQLVVSQELGQEDPLAPTAFLLRAAAKAASALGWGDDVALAELHGSGPRARSVADAAQRPFRDLLEAITHGDADGDAGRDAYGDADGGADGPTLVVVDMSELGVDEAVLNLGAPVLTLGRILYDNQRGSYRSTLALSGEVAPESGAALLARVAELLDAPVRLVL